MDGEGYFTFRSSLMVGVSNTHLPTLRFLAGLYGGSIGRKKKYKGQRPAHEWRCYGSNAKACITAVLPFLREKAPQAMLVLQIAQMKPGRQRAAMIRKLSALKRISFH